MKNEYVLCIMCENSLPKTYYWEDEENPVFQNFWGRTPIKFAWSYLFFNKGNKVQKLLHALKYYGHDELGVYLGEKFGYDLKNHNLIQNIDLIIPVPLHAKKKHKRGFNQSEKIALGFSEVTDIPLNTKVLFRHKAGESQTKKSRYFRYLNVKDVFTIRNKESLMNKKILLIDDVITTGSTIEACVECLKQIKGIEVYAASIAFARN